MQESFGDNNDEIGHDDDIDDNQTMGTDFAEDRSNNSVVTTFQTPVSIEENILKYASSVHRKLYASLKTSSFLSCYHVNVKNESYWYQMRRKLGPKKQNAVMAKQNAISMNWESYYYKMKANEDFEVVPQRIFITSHSSKLAALKKSESMCKERDSNPVENKKQRDKTNLHLDLNKLLSSHFKLTVVSARFYRLSNIERIVLVYEELLKSMCETLLPMNLDQFKNNSLKDKQVNLARCPPLKMKLASYFGDNVCKLPIFKFLLPSTSGSHPDCPLTLIIEARTPSQWKPEEFEVPDSERYGPSHIGFAQSLDVSKSVQPQASKIRIKKIASIDDATTDTNPSSQHSLKLPAIAFPNSKGSSIAESLGIDPKLSGVKYRKYGGVYGHFFKDLQPEIRGMILGKFKENKILIQREGNLNHNLLDDEEGENKNKGRKKKSQRNGLKSSSSLMHVLAEYDKGTSNETEMVEEIVIAYKKLERVTIRLQRMRRIHILCRAIKYIWKRQYAAMKIQKCVRGHFGRLFYNLFVKLSLLASIRIQKCYRNFKSRKILKIWYFLTFRLTRYVLPKIKRFISNTFQMWLKKHNKYATVIQSMVRMYIAKTKYIKNKAEYLYMDVYIIQFAVITIQRVVRGYIGKKRHELLYQKFLIMKIDSPAALRIQRIYRGYIGRLITIQWIRKVKATLLLQRNIKKFVRRVWDEKVRLEKMKKLAATDIQRITRGKIDRLIYKFKVKKKWYENIYIPTVIKLQSIARRFNQQKRFRIFLTQLKAATRIQRSFRHYHKRLAALARWKAMRLVYKNKVATVIQSLIRRFIARRKFYVMQMSFDSKRIIAAKKIMACWQNFKIRKRLIMLMDDNRILIYQRRVKKFHNARIELEVDLKEISQDIDMAVSIRDRLKARLHELDVFTIESAMRIPAIKKEMTSFTQDDFERGWAEAFGNEYESLTHQQTLAKEEMRLIKNLIWKRKKEIMSLMLELEEGEIEADNLSVWEMEAYEGIRRAEITRIERKVNSKWERNVRRERSHWKVDCVRTKVIRKLRHGYNEIMKKARDASGRDLKYSQTVNFETRMQVNDKEDIIAEALLKKDGLRREKDFSTYESYAEPFQKTYDSVVSNTMSLLRDVTLDNRAGLLKEHYQTKKKSENKLRGGQFAPLKEDYHQNKRAFDYLR